MREAKEKALAEIKKRELGYTKDEEERIAKSVSQAAVKYSFLRVSPEKNITFDWESALSFEGETGPYIQYSFARINSILAKAGTPAEKKAKADYALLKSKEEESLIRELSLFPDTIKEAESTLKVHMIAQKTYVLAKVFNEFYHACPVLTAESEELKSARIELIDATRIVLKIGLNLLGIDAPNKM